MGTNMRNLRTKACDRSARQAVLGQAAPDRGQNLDSGRRWTIMRGSDDDEREFSAPADWVGWTAVVVAEAAGEVEAARAT